MPMASATISRKGRLVKNQVRKALSFYTDVGGANVDSVDYYIGNYVAIGVNAVATVAAAVWAHGQIAAFKTQYLTTVDFEQLERRLSRAGTYTNSTFWFDAHLGVFAFALLAVVLLIACAVWKQSLMKNERKLIEAGKAVSA